MNRIKRIGLFSVEILGGIIAFAGAFLAVTALGFGSLFLPFGNELFSFVLGIILAFIGLGIGDGAKNLKIFKKKSD